MPIYKSLNYKSAIKSVLDKLEFPLSISKKSVAFLNDVLNSVNNKLINHCEPKFYSEKISGVQNNSMEVAYDAVKTIFPGELKNNAIAEGHKCIILFYNGLLNYNLSSSPIVVSSAFNTGIRKLGSVMLSDQKLDHSAILTINEFLDDLFIKASEKAIETGSSKNKLEVIDFKNAVRAILPEDIQNHAHSEGNKKVFEHESNVFTFTPGKSMGTFDAEVYMKPKRMTTKRPYEPVKSKESVLARKKAKRTKKPPPQKLINFVSGIREIAKEVNSSLHFSKPALIFLVQVLNELNYKLVDYCILSTENLPDNSNVTMNVAESAVNAYYPGELLQHATAEANKDLFMLDHGMINYNPRKKKPKEEPKKISKTYVYTRGLESLTRTSLPDAILDRKAKTLMEKILQNICASLSHEAARLSKNQNHLGHNDVISALEHTLKGEIYQHAHSEGAKAVLKFEIGVVSFPSHRAKKQKLSLMKKKSSQIKRSKTSLK